MLLSQRIYLPPRLPDLPAADPAEIALVKKQLAEANARIQQLVAQQYEPRVVTTEVGLHVCVCVCVWCVCVCLLCV